MKQRYRALLNAMETGVLVCKLPDLSIFSANQKACALLNTTEEMLLDTTVDEHVKLDKSVLRHLVDSERLKQGYETQLPIGRKPSGRERWFQVNIDLLDAERAEVIIRLDDITEKMSATNELQLLKAAVEHSVDAIVITNADAADPRITFANSAFERLTGYTQEEFLGRNPKFLQGPKTDRSKIETLKQAIFEGRACRVYTYNYRKDGTTYLLEWVTSPVRNERGEIVNWIALQRDITERVKLAREREERDNTLMAAMINGQEMERRRVAEDLHDSLGQMISVTNIEIGHLKQTLNNAEYTPEEAISRIERIQNLMGELAKETRMISRHLLPQLLNDLGMIPAVENLANKMRETVNIRFQVKKMGEPYRLDSAVEIAVFRIVQEAMTNAVKHSQADNVYILFHFQKQAFEAVVRDDGVGMDEEKVAKRREKSMGLNNIETRAKLIKGKITITSEPDDGTVIKLRLPLRPEPNDEYIPEDYVYPPLPTPIDGADYS
ncbi:MAG: PAS domain S-box protein [Bacteroidota bacterium]